MLEGGVDEGEGRMIVRADIAANVWKIEVAVGDQVGADQTLAILESMKMEIPVEAPKAGVVAEIMIAEGQTIAEDQPLFRIE
jgi:acetyl-CoA carboxylase biotin carboxyl carrier protein